MKFHLTRPLLVTAAENVTLKEEKMICLISEMDAIYTLKHPLPANHILTLSKKCTHQLCGEISLLFKNENETCQKRWLIICCARVLSTHATVNCPKNTLKYVADINIFLMVIFEQLFGFS